MTRALIRRAGPADAASLQRLLAVQLAEHHIHISAGELANSIAGVLDVPRRGFFLVALRDGLCIGVAYGTHVQTHPPCRPTSAARRSCAVLGHAAANSACSALTTRWCS
jgi:hypothetical protein